MWDVQGQKLAIPNWLDLEPVRILYEYDGPRIFSCKGAAGNHLLAYLCSEDRTRRRFLLVPFDAGLEQQLTSGRIDLRDGLARSPAWIVDVGNEWQPLTIWAVSINDVPTDMLPRPSVMLWASLPPIGNGATVKAGTLASPPA